MKNAESLQIDLSQITTIVFSHGHNDHTRGITFMDNAFPPQKTKVLAHPDVFCQRYENGLSIGSPFTLNALQQKHEIQLSKEPVALTDRLTFLGEIPCFLEFEKRKPIGIIKKGILEIPDLVMDDTALAYNSSNGLFIITGCSHSGICNIIEYAKLVCHEQKIIGVIGGFHLLSVTDKLKQTISYFKENNIKEVYPCHCVSFAAKAEIHKHIPIHEVGVGLSIKIE